MNTHSSADPVETFVEGLKTTTRLRGVTLLRGADKRSTTGKPNRIVFYPAGGEAAARSKREAIVDYDLQVEAAIWGASDRHVWEILRRLVWGYREWTRSSSSAPLVEWGPLQFDTGDDVGEQGAPLTVTLTLKAQPIEDVEETTEGLINEVTYEREDA